jgi:hypothetical protein
MTAETSGEVGMIAGAYGDVIVRMDIFPAVRPVLWDEHG